jgi:hypothetical protein
VSKGEVPLVASTQGAVGIEEVGKICCGKACFVGGCDIQATLPLKDERAIREEAKLLLDCWETDDGGFILEYDGNGDDLGFGDDIRRIEIDAFMELDRWKYMNR